MFRLSRNFVKCVRKKLEKNISFVFIGLDNAGKTSILTAATNGDHSLISPTWGFNSERITRLGHHVTLYDLGGGATIRGYWHNYYAEVHGIIFVVDASCADKFEEARKCLHEAEEHAYATGKPILIFANKQDLPDARTNTEIAEKLELHKLASSPFHVTPCIGIQVKDGMDRRVMEGIDWAINSVASAYGKLQARVADQSAEQKERERVERENKRRRVLEMREKRKQLDVPIPESSAPRAWAERPAPDPTEAGVATVTEVEGPETNPPVSKRVSQQSERDILLDVRSPQKKEFSLPNAVPG